jgi:nitroreductase
VSKETPTEHPVHALIRGRWSPVGFDARPIPTAELASLFEAARWAPSCFNEQPWRFVMAARDDAEDFARLLACLVPGNQEWAGRAPVLMIGAASLAFARNDKPNLHAYYDLGQAMANLAIEAQARQIYVHQMAGFDAEKARESLAVPEGHYPVVAAAMGYLAAPDALPEPLAQRDQAPRRRRPQAQFLFKGRWGEPVPWSKE